MSERRRGGLLTVGMVWGVWLCLAGAGCSLQIALVDSPNTPKPKPTSPDGQPAGDQTAERPGVVPAGGTLPGPALPGQPLAGLAGTPMLMGQQGHDMPVGLAGPDGAPVAPPPTELQKTSLPPYMIEPPDILVLDTIRLIPKPPYVVQPLDVLLVRVAEPLPGQPIDGSYTVSPDGTINLGFSYGLVRVAGLTLEQVEAAIRQQVGQVLKNPQVAVGLAQFRGVQQVRGEHLVRPDGTISLGSYGCVYITGLTLAQAKVAIERHLSQYMVDPEISLDVFAYNSKVYYVITDGAGYGQQIYRFPITGNETVLDGISNIAGLPPVASKKHIWVARPSPACYDCDQVLPVDWRAITEGGSTATNYQLFPGDRIYVKAQPIITIDNTLAKVLMPIERVLGVTLLGASVYRIISPVTSNGGGTGFGFIGVAR